MTEPWLEPLREGPDITLYRGWQPGNPSPVLAAALAAQQPSSQGFRQLECRRFSMEDWLGRGWRAVAHPEDLDRTAENWRPATRRTV